jgi:site-specific recombinase XerD
MRHKRISRTRWPVIRDPLFGPLRRHIGSFEANLSEQGYTHGVIDNKVRIVRHLNRWLHQKQISLHDLDESQVNKFLRYYYEFHNSGCGNILTLKQLLGLLRNSNAITPPVNINNDDELSLITRKFMGYLRKERGLSPLTLKNYLPTIQRFLSWRFKSNAIVPVNIKPRDVTTYLFNQTRKYSLRRVQLEASALRSFFRFLRFRGDVSIDLASCVPTVANHPRSELPKYLPPEDVDRLLRSCDKTRIVGIRDYAILLLMARLGLRAGELLTMTLDDIKWEEGTITIHGKSGRDEVLPIPKDVGKAIVKYLQIGRPKCATRRLFVRTKAPFRELARDGSICCIVRYACKRIGIEPLHQGAHLLRHSLATRMLNKGASMAEIAEILRHRSTQTTEIYAKVNLRSLRELAKPWPKGAI